MTDGYGAPQGFTSILGCTVSVQTTEQPGLNHLPAGYMVALDVDVRHAEVVLSHADAARLVALLRPAARDLRSAVVDALYWARSPRTSNVSVKFARLLGDLDAALAATAPTTDGGSPVECGCDDPAAHTGG